MDIQPYIAPVISAVLSIGTVGAFVISAAGKSKKYILLANDAITTLKDLEESLEDGKLTAEEQDKLGADINRFQDRLKS